VVEMVEPATCAGAGPMISTMLQKIKGVRRGTQKSSKSYLVEKMALHGKKRRGARKKRADDPTMSMKTKVKSSDKRDDPTMLLKTKKILVRIPRCC